MKATRRLALLRTCAHCGQLFLINPRLGRRHRFCSDAVCKKASRQAARKKWLKKNGGYFRGRQNVDRVRFWRRHHPGYWKKKWPGQSSWRIDLMLSQEAAEMVKFVALQDTIDTHFTLEIRLDSHASNVASQETIAKGPRRLIIRGHAIVRAKSAGKPK